MRLYNKHFKLITILLLLLMVMTGCIPKAVDNPSIPVIEIEQGKDVIVGVPNEPGSQDNPVKDSEDSVTDKSNESIPDVAIDADGVVEGVLEVHFIDVGQGDAMLIKQGSHSMVIDAGDNHYGDTVVDYLRQENIKNVDYVIGTHPHADHIGGLDDVINTFGVKSVILPNKIHTTKTFEDVLKAIESKGLKITTPVVGKQYELGQAKFTILAPNGSGYSNLNEYSVSIIIEFGDNSFVLTGDTETKGEQEIVNNGLKLDADVMKAGHHGSNTSNTDKFLDRVNPDYVVIQVGEGNKYNHPDKDIMDKFEQRGIQIYRNDLHGSIVAISDGTNIKFTTRKGETPPKTTKVENPVVKTLPPKTESVKDVTTVPVTSAFVGTKTTKVFHKADCRHVAKSKNRQEFGNVSEALNAGYRACKTCNP